jgi:hypothetical protein
VALLRVQFNEGSLLRRTLVHVGAFVLGSVAFIGLMSIALVSIARGVVPREGSGADGATEGSSEANTSKGTVVRTPLDKKPSGAERSSEE